MPDHRKTTKATFRRRPRSIREMAIVLNERVVELGDDVHCRAALLAAGWSPYFVEHDFEAARDLARSVRGAEGDAWSFRQWR